MRFPLTSVFTYTDFCSYKYISWLACMHNNRANIGGLKIAVSMFRSTWRDTLFDAITVIVLVDIGVPSSTNSLFYNEI